MTPFEKALAFTLGPEIEGGYSDHPNDRGGVTMNGYTQALYDAWRNSKGHQPRSVTLITAAEKMAIAREEFWQPCNCDSLPEPVCMAVFDMAFNSSPRAAGRALQRSLGFKGDDVDGRIGPKTIAAAKAVGPDLLLAFLRQRADHIQHTLYADHRQIDFVEGWIVRMCLQAYRWGRPSA